MKIGLVVNPIAGVGANLAWKGTDDVDAAWKAIDQGAEQPIWDITTRALNSIPSYLEITWYLGGNYPLGVEGEVVYNLPEQSQSQHTREAVQELDPLDLDLIIFAGGDGTATDIALSVEDTPIIGVPGGVKIFSPCFLHRPEDLGNFLQNWEGNTMEVDILDLDEDAYRQGKARSKLITSAKIPISSSVQAGKASWSSDDSSTFTFIADRINEEGWLDQKLLIGPGSTMRNIFLELGMELSLLGVDVVDHGTVTHTDVTTADLEDTSIDEIWLSPIGNQGHIFGRGNRQIPSELISTVGKSNIRIFATTEKIRETPTLFIDTGDPELDKQLLGYYKVIVGYHEEILRKAK